MSDQNTNDSVNSENQTDNQAPVNADVKKKITYQQVWCPIGTDWRDTVEWEKRTAAITGSDGKVIFRQENIDMPKEWSQLATNIVASKYFYGENGTPERETSLAQLITRVCNTIANWGWEDGYFETKEDAQRYENDLCWLAVHQYFAFNSPVWFNVGIEKNPQTSACFIQHVDDTLDSIMQLAVNEANLFKFGSGTGTDLSTIRSMRETLAGGGKPSGPLSFMRIYNEVAHVVKSGGKTRRAAKMQSLKDWHPDIMEFIEAKAIEERKAKLLIENGYTFEEAYATVPYQNANLSVRVSDDFMKAVEADEEWVTRWVTDRSHIGPVYKARDIFGKIAKCCWECGDPGLQFDTRMNDWHTCPKSGRINASNPCSEYLFLDDSACNLASINLMKFRNNDGTFNTDLFTKVIDPVFTAQEIIIDRSSFPTPEISVNSHKFRPIGLGYTNLGALLMSLGLPYDSDEGRGLCGGISAVLTGYAYLVSSRLAAVRGPFEGYELNKNDMLNVIDKHYHYIKLGKLLMRGCPQYLNDAAAEIWKQVILEGGDHGFRNAQATVLAPTGTISFMMDAATTGIEPELALVKFKQLAGGGTLKLVNSVVPLALQYLGYSEEEINLIENYVLDNGAVDGAPVLKPEHIPVFDCSFGKRALPWSSHIKMMAVAQPFISGAISKTVNMPASATVEDMARAYMLAWKAGLKCVALYRDGSKGAQPLNLKNKGDVYSKKGRESIRKEREHLPEIREAKTHKFSISGHDGYLTVGFYPDGRPGELFITMSKNGSTIGGLVDCFAIAVSLGLQSGIPLKEFVDKFAWTRFEPSGVTSNEDIPVAKSIIDYVFRWLEWELITKADTKEGSEPSRRNIPDTMDDQFASYQTDAPICDNCGSITVRNGACYLCHNCGKSMGCG